MISEDTNNEDDSTIISLIFDKKDEVEFVNHIRKLHNESREMVPEMPYFEDLCKRILINGFCDIVIKGLNDVQRDGKNV